MWLSKRGKLLCKDFASTGAFLTPEAADMHVQMNGASMTGKVMNAPTVSAVDSRRDGPTIRTRSCQRYCSQCEDDLISNINLLKKQILSETFWKNDHCFLLDEAIGEKWMKHFIVPHF